MVSIQRRCLIKSRYKPTGYLYGSIADSFLRALVRGAFQVDALVQSYFSLDFEVASMDHDQSLNHNLQNSSLIQVAALYLKFYRKVQ